MSFTILKPASVRGRDCGRKLKLYLEPPVKIATKFGMPRRPSSQSPIHLRMKKTNFFSMIREVTLISSPSLQEKIWNSESSAMIGRELRLSSLHRLHVCRRYYYRALKGKLPITFNRGCFARNIVLLPQAIIKSLMISFLCLSGYYPDSLKSQ